MSITLGKIADYARTILHDTTSVRWSDAELCEWINIAWRKLVELYPASMVAMMTMNATTGSKQTLPIAGARLIDVIANDGSYTSRAIIQAERRHLDDQIDDWHSATPGAYGEVQLFCFDDRDSDVFYTYPPSTYQTMLKVVFSFMPDKRTLAQTFTGTRSENNAVTCELSPCFLPAILFYVLYLAYSKDADYANNAERAELLHKLFESSVTTAGKAREVSGIKDRNIGTYKATAERSGRVAS